MNPQALVGRGAAVRPRLPAPSQALFDRLAAARRRLLLLDYDGTLAPFRVERTRAVPAPGVLPALRRILARGAAEVTVVSGRPAKEIAALLGGLDVGIFGAHGWECRRPGGKVERRPLSPDQSAALEAAVDALAAAGVARRRIERKHSSAAVHVRGLVPRAARRTEKEVRRLFARIAAGARAAGREPAMEVRGFDGGVELRARGADKGTAVREAIERAGAGAFAVYMGDDETDEDAFRALAALGGRGAGILVQPVDRPTAASFRTTQEDVPGLLGRMAALGAPGGAARAPGRAGGERRPARARRLVVVSNRLPELQTPEGLEEKKNPSVGGLVSALKPALERSPESLWFGWSGRAVPAAEAGRLVRGRAGPVRTIGMDLSEADVDGHYYGYCNRALWPLFHTFHGRVSAEARDRHAFERVNAAFARALGRRLGPHDVVWAHDYHLLLFGSELRRRGFEGPLGFFLHIPFPPPEIFQTLPGARRLLEGLLAYDLVGFQTERSVTNYARAVAEEFRVERRGDGWVEAGGRRQRVGAYPIGIDPGPHREWAREEATRRRAERLREWLRERQIILGVDRLDYTKGIPQRLRAFGRLLEIAPRFRKKVCFIQISAPSRTRIPEYIQQRREVEELVGRINGEHGEEDWVPVRYLFRSYSQHDLAAFYREADVCLVSPLRDGMNLVAKEYVASQVDDPGVLLLSRFTGAADELKEALIVNPYDLDETALALARALEMPLEERARRQRALLARVLENTAAAWADRFLADLRGEAGLPPPVRPPHGAAI